MINRFCCTLLNFCSFLFFSRLPKVGLVFIFSMLITGCGNQPLIKKQEKIIQPQSQLTPLPQPDQIHQINPDEDPSGLPK